MQQVQMLAEVGRVCPIIFGNTHVLIRASFYVCQSECMDMRLCTRVVKGQGCRLSRTQTREFLLLFGDLDVVGCRTSVLCSNVT